MNNERLCWFTVRGVTLTLAQQPNTCCQLENKVDGSIHVAVQMILLCPWARHTFLNMLGENAGVWVWRHGLAANATSL